MYLSWPSPVGIALRVNYMIKGKFRDIRKLKEPISVEANLDLHQA
jgi:hypothetical protein